MIWNVLKWSPAIKAWVKNGDIVIKANNVELKELSLVDAVSKIKWPAWSEVILNIFRTWEKDLLNIKVVRDKIKIPSVEGKMFEKDKIWYIAINMFWETTALDFENELKKMDKTEGLIIDLRDNWGWYLMSAVEILSHLIENWKPVVKTKYKNFLKNEIYPSQNIWKIYDKKMIILINWNSASASEITAWALRDYDKAILVWEKSYWKWSVQEPFNLKDWSMVKLTIAKWFTPKDRAIDKVWITPDIKVSFEKPDFEKKYDRQLEEWKKILKEFIKTWALQLTVDKYNNSSKKTK
jgi:carboxyl-terminal processing protease